MRARHSKAFSSCMCFLVLLSLAIKPTNGAAQNNITCGTLENAFGPFDYTDERQYRYKENLHLVESAHFTKDVEQLKKGSTGAVWQDLKYTLQAWPNHHRALYAMAKFLRSQNASFSEEKNMYSAECYFKRALRMSPNDYVVFMLFGLHLHSIGKLPEAKDMYIKSIELSGEYAESHYNYGLLLVDMGMLKEAKDQAMLAKKYGYPLTGLTSKIERQTNAIMRTDK